MPFKRGIPACTRQQQDRQDSMRELGCSISLLLGQGYVPAEVHHLTYAGRTRSQDHTVAVNSWSHRGYPCNGLSADQCRFYFGPSFAHGSKTFFAYFEAKGLFSNNDEWLELQNAMLEKYLSITTI